MRVIFIRHGERVDNQETAALTPHGRDMATAARAWLAEKGHVPTHAFHTGRVRTVQTSDILLEGAGVVASKVRSMPRDWTTWPTFISESLRGAGDGSVLLVGHQPTQNMLERVFPEALAPTNNRCAGIVLESTADGTWRCQDYYAGTPRK